MSYKTYFGIVAILLFTLLCYLSSFNYLPLIVFLFSAFSILLDRRTYLIYALAFLSVDIFKGLELASSTLQLVRSLLPIALSLYLFIGYFKPYWISSLSIPLLLSYYFSLSKETIEVEFSVLLISTISIVLLGLEVRAVVLSGILNLITATVAYELSLPLSNQLSDISYLLLLTGIIGLLIPNKVNVKAGVFSLVSLLFLLQPAHEYSLIFLSIGVSSLFPPLAIVYAISLALIFHSYYLLLLSLLYPVLRYIKLTGFLPFSLDFIILQHLDVVDWLVALVIGVITGIVSKRDSWSYLISSVSLFLLSYLVTNSITNVMMIPFITLGYSLGVLIPMSVRTSSPPSFILTLTPSVVLLLSILSFIYYGISDVVNLAFVFSLAYFLFRASNLVRPFLSIDLAVFLTLISPFVLAYSLFVKWKYRFILSLLYLASFPLLFHTIPLELLAVSAVTLFPTLKWKYSNLLPGSLIIPYAFPLSLLVGYLLARKKWNLVDIFLIQLTFSFLILVSLIFASNVYSVIRVLLTYLSLFNY